MKGMASALEISAKIMRENMGDATTARRLITERIHGLEAELRKDPINTYLQCILLGFKGVLEAMYKAA